MTEKIVIYNSERYVVVDEGMFKRQFTWDIMPRNMRSTITVIEQVTAERDYMDGGKPVITTITRTITNAMVIPVKKKSVDVSEGGFEFSVGIQITYQKDDMVHTMQAMRIEGSSGFDDRIGDIGQ